MQKIWEVKWKLFDSANSVLISTGSLLGVSLLENRIDELVSISTLELENLCLDVDKHKRALSSMKVFSGSLIYYSNDLLFIPQWKNILYREFIMDLFEAVWNKLCQIWPHMSTKTSETTVWYLIFS